MRARRFDVPGELIECLRGVHRERRRPVDPIFFGLKGLAQGQQFKSAIDFVGMAHSFLGVLAPEHLALSAFMVPVPRHFELWVRPGKGREW